MKICNLFLCAAIASAEYPAEYLARRSESAPPKLADRADFAVPRNAAAKVLASIANNEGSTDDTFQVSPEKTS